MQDNFQRIFWILSKLCRLSSVSELCHTWQDCSTIDLMYKMYMFSRSSTGTQNDTNLCRSLILELVFWTRYLVLSTHVNLFFTMTPNSLVCVMTFTVSFSTCMYSTGKLVLFGEVEDHSIGFFVFSRGYLDHNDAYYYTPLSFFS